MASELASVQRYVQLVGEDVPQQLLEWMIPQSRPSLGLEFVVEADVVAVLEKAELDTTGTFEEKKQRMIDARLCVRRPVNMLTAEELRNVLRTRGIPHSHFTTEEMLRTEVSRLWEAEAVVGYGLPRLRDPEGRCMHSILLMVRLSYFGDVSL